MQGLTKNPALEAENRILHLYLETGRSWVRLGVLLAEFSDKQMYHTLGYGSFDQWIVAKKLGRSTVYDSMKTVRALEGKIPLAHLDGMIKQNAKMLLLLSPSQQSNPEVIESAKTMTEVDFKETMMKSMPDGHHLEGFRRMTWTLTDSLYEVIDRCIEKAMALEGTDSRYAGLERIFSEWELDQ